MQKPTDQAGGTSVIPTDSEMAVDDIGKETLVPKMQSTHLRQGRKTKTMRLRTQVGTMQTMLLLSTKTTQIRWRKKTALAHGP
jgi:hypothetical protein